MTISESKQEDAILLSVQGRVDTNTSPQLQSSILQSFQKSSHLILDLEQVDYLSSAGLRALLIGQKTANSKGGSMVLRNVCEGVRKVFEMTGFSGILTVE